MDRTEDAKRRWQQEVDAAIAVMLGIEGSSEHFQPMAPHLDYEDGSVWFFTRKSTDLVASVGEGARAHMITVGADGNFYACSSGTLVQKFDEAKRDEFWSPVVDAWFVEGKSDPDLSMLHFVPSDAAVWVNEKRGLAFAWEIMKANINDREADTGWQANIRF